MKRIPLWGAAAFSGVTAAGSGGTVMGRFGVSCGLEHSDSTLTLTAGSLTARGYNGAIASPAPALDAPVFEVSGDYDGLSAFVPGTNTYTTAYLYVCLREAALGFSGGTAVSGTRLSYSLTLPDTGEKGLLVAAWYDPAGRLLGTATKNLTCGGQTETDSLTVGAGAARYRAFAFVPEGGPICGSYSKRAGRHCRPAPCFLMGRHRCAKRAALGVR